MSVLDETRAIFAVESAVGRLVMGKKWPWKMALVRVSREPKKHVGKRKLLLVAPIKKPHHDKSQVSRINRMD
jgi:hypothetical protein